ncbi:MAG TPA: nuclear transport factor 2 family protein [Vicinamibacterales bacterium]|nr:nuclear transport factor 2 family protein [Vicinamibacterales bacterium]
MGANGDIVKGIYAAFARGDVPAVLGTFDGGIVWNEAEGYRFAAGNPYVGANAILQNVFMPLVMLVDGFTVTPSNVIDGGDHVAVEGRYTGTVQATGARLDAQFVHVYELRGGKIVTFQQYTDTAQWTRALGD